MVYILSAVDAHQMLALLVLFSGVPVAVLYFLDLFYVAAKLQVQCTYFKPKIVL